MTKEEFKTARLNAGWSARDCAANIGVTVDMVYKYEQGAHPIPQPVVKLMALLAKPCAKVTRS
jgi:DNA-binding transcriptional regulator YiaG